jgi:hypothetical protein
LGCLFAYNKKTIRHEAMHPCRVGNSQSCNEYFQNFKLKKRIGFRYPLALAVRESGSPSFREALPQNYQKKKSKNLGTGDDVREMKPGSMQTKNLWIAAIRREIPKRLSFARELELEYMIILIKLHHLNQVGEFVYNQPDFLKRCLQLNIIKGRKNEFNGL